MLVGRLVLASPASSGWSYSLPRVSGCLVGDGLAVLKNTGTVAMRVVGLRTDVRGVPSASPVHVTYQVLAVRRGSTPGELSASGPLTRLLPAHVLPSAEGAWLRPASSSGLWYVVVARLRVDAELPHRWSVTGVGVRYAVGSHTATATFPQHVTLSMAGTCSATRDAPTPATTGTAR